MSRVAPVTAPPDISYQVRDYDPADEPEVVDFLRLVLGPGRSFVRGAPFWRWKHFENPFGTSQLLLAANEHLLGLRAFMRWGLVVPDHRLRAVRAVDTSTHPAYRRLGVFSRLTRDSLQRARGDGVHLVFNSPNPQSMAGYLKMGWHFVGRTRLLVRVLRPLRLATSLLARRARPQRPDPGEFFRTPPRSIDDLLDSRERLARIITFDSALCGDRIHTDRSVEFLRWRYASAPSLSYAAVWSGAQPVTCVLIVRPSYRFGLKELMLSEVLMGYGSAPHLRETIHSLEQTTTADYLVASAPPGSQHWGMLRLAGFVPLPSGAGPYLTAYPLNWPDNAPDPRLLTRWQLSLGDLEIF